MAKHTIVNTVKKNRVQKYSYCPQCGMKGLYYVHQQYCRCRYCGLYRISLPGQDF